MPTITLAFYRARGTIFDRLVRWRTRSEYSHVEIILPSGWYTSSNREGGVRRRDMLPQAGHWDYVTIDANTQHIVELYARTAWDRYDWLGIAGHTIGVPRLHCRHKWTCSEWVAAALGLDKPYLWMPQRLYEWAKKNP